MPTYDNESRDDYILLLSRQDLAVIANCLLNAQEFFDEDFFQTVIGVERSVANSLHRRLIETLRGPTAS